MTPDIGQSDDIWLVGGGAMGALIRKYDWSSTSLGPIETWPQSLRLILRMMLANKFPCILAWGPELTCFYNDSYRPLLGAKPEALGRPFLEVWLEVYDIIKPLADKARAGEASYIEAAPFTLMRNGSPEEAYFDFSLSPVYDESGTVAGMLNTAVETTRRVQDQQTLRTSEERLRNVLRIKTVGVMFWGEGFGLTEVNDAFLSMTGFTRDEALGLTWQELTPKEFHPASLKAVEEVTTLGETTPYEKQYFRKDRSRWWGLFAARKIGDEVVEFVLDVTRRKLAETALRETEQRFRLVVEGAHDYAIFITDEQDTITDWFPGAANVFGWSAEEIVGQSSTILFTPEDREKKVPAWEFDTARREGAAPNVRWHLRKDGQRVFIEGQNVALRQANGSLRGFLKIGQDVTARHAAEMALRASRDEAEEANRAKSRFLAAASHDLRQPVTAANLYMDLLQRRLADPDHRNLADLVRTSLDGLLGLLNGLLEIARLDAGIVQPDMQPVMLDDLLHRLSVEFEAQAKAARLWLQVPPTSAMVSTDRLLLELILRNLIGNALKYTQRGGVSVETLEEGDTVRIDVRDTGSGIPKDLLGRIFDDFYQAGDPAGQSRGFGIGLATVRRATQALDCRLEVESKPGRGSVFSIWLPRTGEAPPREPASVSKPTTNVEDLSGHTILMVEDDLLIGMALAMELEETGLSIVRANSLAAAQARLDEQSTSIDLVLSDYQLGDGNGLQVIETVRERWPAPAILLTGDTAPDILQQARKASVRLMHKPVLNHALRQAIAELLAVDREER
jgi:PAS domain S-box-containing protein